MFVLRSSLHDESDFRVEKAWAFSPDFVSQYGRTLSTQDLQDSFDHFIAVTLQPNDSNFIYLRGRDDSTGTPKTSAFTLRAVPGELILWPQVWKPEPVLPPGLVTVVNDGTNSVVASDTAFEFHPSNLYGFHYAFVAVQKEVNDGDSNDIDDFDEVVPPPRDMGNWREYRKFLENDDSVAYSNIRVADPLAPCISICTRLRLFEDDPQMTRTHIKIIVEHAGVPEGVEVSLASDDGRIRLPLTKLIDKKKEIGVEVQLPSTYSTVLTLSIFQPPGSPGVTCFGWVSLQAIVITPAKDECLLGAETIMFNSDATRNVRLFHPLAEAVEGQANEDVRSDEDNDEDEDENEDEDKDDDNDDKAEEEDMDNANDEEQGEEEKLDNVDEGAMPTPSGPLTEDYWERRRIWEERQETTHPVNRVEGVSRAKTNTKATKKQSPQKKQSTKKKQPTKQKQPTKKKQSTPFRPYDKNGRAHGWWFRTHLAATNYFPRTVGNPAESPDIVPSRSKYSNPQSALGNLSVDFHQDFALGRENYAYIRGQCTVSGLTLQCRLFMLPTNLQLRASDFETYEVKNPPMISAKSTRRNQVIVFKVPFKVTPKWNYCCLVAEVREVTDNDDLKAGRVQQKWPHKDPLRKFMTPNTYGRWLRGHPRIAWRNVHVYYLPYNYAVSGGGTTTMRIAVEACDITLPLRLDILADPRQPNAIYQLAYTAEGFPESSEWRLSCDGDLNIRTEKVAGNYIVCHFSGVSTEGYEGTATLEWWGKGSWPTPGAKVTQVLSEIISPSNSAIYAKYAADMSNGQVAHTFMANYHSSAIITARGHRPAILNKMETLTVPKGSKLVALGANVVIFKEKEDE